MEALPCLEDGSLPEDGEVFLEDPTELIGKTLHFILKINEATGLPTRFSKVLHILMYIQSSVQIGKLLDNSMQLPVFIHKSTIAIS